MKNCLSVLVCLWLANTANAQSVGIGTTIPNTGAVLDVSSASKAMIVPRLSSTAINSLTGTDGMLVFNTDTKTFWGYSSGGISTPISQTLSNASFNTVTGNDVGQSFTLATDIVLNAIGVTVTTAGSGGICQMRLHNGAGYSGAIIGTATLNLFTGGTYYFDFSTLNIQLTAGQVYTFEVDNLTSSGASYVNFPYATVSIYPYGNFYGNIASYTSYDLLFYIRQGVSAGWKSLSR